jgi:hypothetical protein
LGGTIPEEIGKLTLLSKFHSKPTDKKVRCLVLSYLGKLTNKMFVFCSIVFFLIPKVRLDISKNNLSGIIPDTIGSIEGLSKSALSNWISMNTLLMT